MFGQLKTSLVLLLGVAMILSACRDITQRPKLTFQGATSFSSLLATRQLSQGKSQAQTTTANKQAERENYKPIALGNLTSTLRGSDPKAIALSAFGNLESEGGSRDVKVNYPQPNLAIVTITQTGVADDSVGAIRYRAEFRQNESPPTGKQWEMIWAGSQVKCQLGRGHQDWSTELCL